MATTHHGPDTERLAFGNYARDHGELPRPARRAPLVADADDVRPPRGASFAEGSRYQDTYERVHARDGLRAFAGLVGRIFLASIFAISGAAKLLHTPETVAYMTGAGVPAPETLVYVAAGAELLGALALVLGLFSRAAAIGLVLFLVPTTLLFHHFWDLEGAAALTQQVSFLKNVSIMGGLLMVAACGPGRYSVDHRRHARAF